MAKPTGRPNGRPPKYATPEAMQEKIDDYFENCWDTSNDGLKKQVTPYTMTGLANSIGFSRRALLDYTKKDEFLPTIIKARSICEQYAEESLFNGKNVAGAIFNIINNYNRWKNTQGREITGKDGGPVKTEQVKSDITDKLNEIYES